MPVRGPKIKQKAQNPDISYIRQPSLASEQASLHLKID